jgi:hypothetical protein
MVEVTRPAGGRREGGTMSFDKIFNPGMNHQHEERQRKRIEAQIPKSEGDPLRDFEQGIIRITLNDAPTDVLHGPAESASAEAPGAEDQTEG